MFFCLFLGWYLANYSLSLISPFSRPAMIARFVCLVVSWWVFKVVLDAHALWFRWGSCRNPKRCFRMSGLSSNWRLATGKRHISLATKSLPERLTFGEKRNWKTKNRPHGRPFGWAITGPWRTSPGSWSCGPRSASLPRRRGAGGFGSDENPGRRSVFGDGILEVNRLVFIWVKKGCQKAIFLEAYGGFGLWMLLFFH